MKEKSNDLKAIDDAKMSIGDTLIAHTFLAVRDYIRKSKINEPIETWDIDKIIKLSKTKNKID